MSQTEDQLLTVHSTVAKTVTMVDCHSWNFPAIHSAPCWARLTKLVITGARVALIDVATPSSVAHNLFIELLNAWAAPASAEVIVAPEPVALGGQAPDALLAPGDQGQHLVGVPAPQGVGDVVPVPGGQALHLAGQAGERLGRVQADEALGLDPELLQRLGGRAAVQVDGLGQPQAPLLEGLGDRVDLHAGRLGGEG